MPQRGRYYARGYSEWDHSPLWYAQQEEIGAGVGFDEENAEPWAFPPGTPGAESGPRPDPVFMEWLERHDPRMTVKWNPVAEEWVIWRWGEDERWHCCFPCENPFRFRWADLEPEEPMRVLDNRIKAMLIDSDPRTYGGSDKMLDMLKDRRRDGKAAILQRELERMRHAREDARRRVRIWSGYGTTGGDKVGQMYR